MTSGSPTPAIQRLNRTIDSRPDRPQVGGPDHPMRRVTRQIAFEPGGWDADRKAKVIELFDSLAAGWNDRFTSEESWQPLDDAFQRGGMFPSPCLEVGAGTGLATTRLTDHFSSVIALDVSRCMLERFVEPKANPILGDAGSLPIATNSVGTIVAVNAFLFPAEYDRVLRHDGVLLWVNSLAEDTPIHLSVDDVVAALPGRWKATCAEAGWGIWAAVRRA